jgi:hypothetical protein
LETVLNYGQERFPGTFIALEQRENGTESRGQGSRSACGTNGWANSTQERVPNDLRRKKLKRKGQKPSTIDTLPNGQRPARTNSESEGHHPAGSSGQLPLSRVYLMGHPAPCKVLLQTLNSAN